MHVTYYPNIRKPVFRIQWFLFITIDEYISPKKTIFFSPYATKIFPYTTTPLSSFRRTRSFSQQIITKLLVHFSTTLRHLLRQCIRARRVAATSAPNLCKRRQNIFFSSHERARLTPPSLYFDRSLLWHSSTFDRAARVSYLFSRRHGIILAPKSSYGRYTAAPESFVSTPSESKTLIERMTGDAWGVRFWSTLECIVNIFVKFFK